MTVCSFGMAQSKQAYAVLSDDGKTLTFHYDANKSTYDDDHVSGLNTYDQVPGWHKPYDDSGNNPNIVEKVIFEESFQDVRPVSTYCWFLEQEKLTTIEGLEYLNTSEVLNMAEMFSQCKSLTGLDLSDFDTRKVENMRSMFYWCNNLKYIELSSFNTKNVTDMADMFDGCESLESINLLYFKTTNVTDMSGMFCDCRSLHDLNLKSFDTQKVENMGRMFSDCYKLVNLDLTSFDTQNVTDMTTMFASCNRLVRLNLTSFDTNKVKSMAAMFSGADELSKIYVGENWSTASLLETAINGYTNGGVFMFNNCIQLKGGEGTTYNSGHIDNEYARVDHGGEAPGYLSARPSGYVVYNAGVLTFYNDGKQDEKTGEKFILPIEDEGYPAWTDCDESVQKVVFDASFSTSQPVTMYDWFFCFSNLTTIEGITNLNTSKVTNMSGVFYECNKLTGVNVGNWDTSNVTNMSQLFMGCEMVKSLDVGNWDTSNVTDMERMFSMCQNLTTLNLHKWNTSKVTNTTYMFYDCRNLTSIYVGDNWNMDNVGDRYSDNMFRNCSQLVGGAGTVYTFDDSAMSPYYLQDKTFAHVDGGEGNPGYLSERPSGYVVLEDNSLTFYNDGKMDEKDGRVYPLNIGSENPTWPRNRAVDRVVFDESFATARPVSTFFWFNGCTILTEFVGMQYLNTSEVTTMEGMFMDCKSIANLDLSYFNTSKVTRMPSMFASCNNLQELDLSNFDTSNVTSMTMMFNGCKGLKTLDLSSFNTSNVAYMIYMFSECSELKTLNIGSFNTGNAADQMGMMFQNCGNLTTIYVGRKWTVSNNGCYAMFSGCNSLVGGQGTKLIETEYDPSMNTFAHIDGGPSNPGYLSERPSGYVILEGNSLTFYNDGKMDEKSGTPFLLNVDEESPTWSRYMAVERVVFDESFATARPVSTISWFNGYSNITEIEGIEYLNTSKVTNMTSMFQGCSKIKSLDLSHFNTSKVTNMSTMFLDCSDLETLNLGSFNTSNVTEMVMMFTNCENLQTIYVGSNWKAADDGQCWSMFKGCNSLVGGQGTKYADTAYDSWGNKYAHIDGIGGPGYLTAAPSLGIATSLNQVTSDKSQVTSDEWYTIDGRKLNGKPAEKGIYIHNGKKAVVH